MKIRLVNFLCYIDSTFDFNTEGLTLISGSSGVGKSSILKGIFFVLFGEGNKVQHYGKTSCSVELEFEDMKIIRTKRPNHLVINDIYEDAAAQEIINKKFGVTFKTSGYIQQNNLSSFILLSPIDKLAFLEKFSFQDIDLGKMKGRCKKVISETHDELLSTTAQLDMSTKILAEIDIGVVVDFPILGTKEKKLNDKNRIIAIKNENTKYKNTTTLLAKLFKNKQKYHEKLVDLKIFIGIYNSTKESIDNINNKLKKNSIEEEGILYIGDEKLDLLLIYLQQIINGKELENLRLVYDDNTKKLLEMKQVEMKNYINDLSIITENLWKEYNKNELKNTLDELKLCMSDGETIIKLQIRLEKIDVTEKTLINEKSLLETHKLTLDNLIILTKQNKLYNCPECKAKLHLVDEKLILSNSYIEDMSKDEIDIKIDSITDIISILEKNINTTEKKLNIKLQLEHEIKIITDQYEEIPDISSIKEDIIYLQQYQITQVENEKRAKDLQNYIDNKIFSNSCNNFQKDTEKLFKKIEFLGGSTTDQVYNEEELRNNIFDQKQNKHNIERLKLSNSELINEKEGYLVVIQTKQKEFIQKFSSDNYLLTELESSEEELNFENMKVEIENILTKIDIKICRLESENSVYKNNIELIEKWQQWYTEKKKYDEWSEKCIKLKEKEKEDRYKYSAAMTMKNKILEAESIAIGNVIDTINLHAREYLDCFFPDHPIAVQLQAFKENKKTAAKPCINVIIEYKGMECDINMLSGGELARIVLAYTLALSEIFNTPILLLDECTASLDQELTNIVFDGIRENFKGKLVLIIAHQIIMGTFDKIITLK